MQKPTEKVVATVTPVRPNVSFPLDLLRSQQCLPLAPSDSEMIAKVLTDPLVTCQPVLIRLIADKKDKMTFDPVEWAKAGWQIEATEEVGDPLANYYLLMDACRSGVNIVWWKPHRQGYTTDVAEAGVYGPGDALQMERIGGDVIAVPVPLANRYATSVVTEEKRLALLGDVKAAKTKTAKEST